MVADAGLGRAHARSIVSGPAYEGVPPGSGGDAVLEIDNLIRKVTNGAGREAHR